MQASEEAFQEEAGAPAGAISNEATANELVTVAPASIVEHAPEFAVGRNSVEAVETYIASVHSERSRDTIRRFMRRIARILGVETGPSDRESWRRVPWVLLTARETTAIQA